MRTREIRYDSVLKTDKIVQVIRNPGDLDSYGRNPDNSSVAGLLAKSQYSEGPATGHLDTDFSWFPVSERKC